MEFRQYALSSLPEQAFCSMLATMSIAAEKIAEALALPEEDRAFLARQLIASLDDAVDEDAQEQWDQVIDRRSLEIEEGKVQCRLADDGVRDIRKKLHARCQPSLVARIKEWTE
jgi:hypothetical protein